MNDLKRNRSGKIIILPLMITHVDPNLYDLSWGLWETKFIFGYEMSLYIYIYIYIYVNV